MAPIRTVWITRARPGCDRTAERLSVLGFTPLVAPLLRVRPLDVRLDLAGVQALAFTSRNGVRAFAEQSPIPPVPVFAVGNATAAAARQAGFADVRSADGDLNALAALIRAEGRGLAILQLSAAEPAGDLGALVGGAARVTPLPIYEAVETAGPIPPIWDAVLIHSPRAARVLATRLSSDVARRRVALAISPAAAAPLTDMDFAEIHVADAPTEAGLLAALGKRGASV